MENTVYDTSILLRGAMRGDLWSKAGPNDQNENPLFVVFTSLLKNYELLHNIKPYTEQILTLR